MPPKARLRGVRISRLQGFSLGKLETRLTLDPHAGIPRPDNEAERLAALYRYGVLDTAADADFDLLAEIAAQLCGAPFAFISFVDADRVWYKASVGKKATQTPRDLDYCSWAILEDVLLSIPDLRQDHRTACIPLTAGPPFYQMYNGANLVTSDGMRIGTLCVLDTKPAVLSDACKNLLVRLARQVVALMDLRLRDREMAEALVMMQRLATEDSLTGLLNRRAFLDKLESEYERSRRFDSPLALLLLDLDHFKQINDGYGHAMGDVILRTVGEILKTRLRIIDSAGRYGGEELCVLLPGTDLEGALIVAESLRQAIASTAFVHEGKSASATASFGVAMTTLAGAGASALLQSADAAMYHAKRGGRNQVAVADNSGGLIQVATN